MNQARPAGISPGAAPIAAMSTRSQSVAAWTATTPTTRKPAAVGIAAYNQLPGAASQATYGPDGSLWVLATMPSGADKYIYHYADGSWSAIPGLASRLAVAPDNTLYAINSSGSLFHFTPTLIGASTFIGPGTWAGLGGQSRDLAVDSSGAIYVVGLSTASDGPIYRNVGGTWAQIAGSGARIATSNDGYVYVTSSTGSIFTSPTSAINYSACLGRAARVVPTAGGSFLALGAPLDVVNGSSIYLFTPVGSSCTSGSFSAIPGSGVDISATTRDIAVIGANGGIFAAIYSSSPQPSATPLVDAPLVAGASFTYRSTYGSVYTAGPKAPVPMPTNGPGLTQQFVTTVLANQSFNGVANIYGVQTVSGRPSNVTTSVYNVQSTTYENIVPTTTGADLLIYGTKASNTNGGSLSMFSSVQTQIDLVPYRYQTFPDRVVSYDASSNYTTTYSGILTAGTANTPCYQLDETIAAPVDGSYMYKTNSTYFTPTSTCPSINAATYTSAESVSPPPVSGTYRSTSTGYTDYVETAGTPVLDGRGGYVIPFTIQQSVALPSPAPAPTTTTIPMWYQSGPMTPYSTSHIDQLGYQALSPSCTIPTSVGSVFTGIRTTETQLDPFNAQYTLTITRYIAPGFGRVCSVSTQTIQYFDETTGLLRYTQLYNSVTSLIGTSGPNASAHGRTSQSIDPAVGPGAIDPPQPTAYTELKRLRRLPQTRSSAENLGASAREAAFTNVR